MVRPLAYITSDWSDDEFEARSMARKFCRNVYEAGFSPICPKLMYTDLFRDEVPQGQTGNGSGASAQVPHSGCLR